MMTPPHYNVYSSRRNLKILYGGTKKEAAVDENPDINLASLKLAAWKLLALATGSRKKADRFWRQFHDDRVKKYSGTRFWSIHAEEIRTWVYYKELAEESNLEVEKSE